MSDYLIENLYTTPIYASMVYNIEGIQEEIRNASVAYTTIESWGRPHHISTIDFNSDLIKDHNLVETEKMIHHHLHNYCVEIGFDIREYTRQSWLSKFRNKEYGQIHNHHIADISGVYYFQTNEEDGDLFFESPVAAIHSSLCFGEKYGIRWKHKPKVGKIVLFPSWLNHGIMTNLTDNERISLSFNINFKR